MAEEVTYYEFLTHTKDYLKQLISKPSTARVDAFLEKHLSEIGETQQSFLKLLIERGIVEKSVKINDNLETPGAEPTFSIKYRIPRKKFEWKMKKLHVELFELPTSGVLNESEGVDEATGAASSGQFSQPLFGGVVRRKIYITPEQAKVLGEATTTQTAGDYQYTVPFPAKKDDPAMVHNKPGGISCERLDEKKDFKKQHGIEEVSCGLGWSEKEQKWYGWSHRAIHGFGVGDKAMECYPSGNKEGKKCKTLEDCKQAAIAFANSVS